MILAKEKDPMGRAIFEFWQKKKAKKLRVLSSMFDEDEIPVKHLFRTEREIPKIERMALSLAKGKVLDVGAGAGCHSLVLQNKGLNVTAIDISPLSCETMRMRGVQNAICIDLYDSAFKGKFDTILMLMNGTGIAGKISNLPKLFNRLKELLTEEGQVLIDSSDLKYLYEDEDGNYDIAPNGPYYGEVDYQMIYDNTKGASFDWLYVDFPLLSAIAQSCGLKAELILEGDHCDYLAKITYLQ